MGGKAVDCHIIFKCAVEHVALLQPSLSRPVSEPGKLHSGTQGCLSASSGLQAISIKMLSHLYSCPLSLMRQSCVWLPCHTLILSRFLAYVLEWNKVEMLSMDPKHGCTDYDTSIRSDTMCYVCPHKSVLILWQRDVHLSSLIFTYFESAKNKQTSPLCFGSVEKEVSLVVKWLNVQMSATTLSQLENEQYLMKIRYIKVIVRTKITYWYSVWQVLSLLVLSLIKCGIGASLILKTIMESGCLQTI